MLAVRNKLITHVTVIDDTTFRNISLFEQYAAAAYCDANRNPVNTLGRISCAGAVTSPLDPIPLSNCPNVESAGATIVAKLSNNSNE
jgi:hypothetical protein